MIRAARKGRVPLGDEPTIIPVPALNLAANFAALREELLREIADVCASGTYVLGPKVAEFEAAMAQYCGVRFALGMSSGTDALLAALMALNVGPGDEVIVPAFTFFATAGCPARLGARPVFCDVDPETFNCAAAHIEPLVTPRTRAIVPVHLYGQMAEMDGIMALAGRRRLPVIEDAAQAIGAYGPDAARRRAGSIGTFGCLSFYPTKNLGAVGDAGMLLTSDAELHARARLLRLHGENPRYHHRLIGGNFRIDALQAAILNVKLRRLEEWTQRRRERAARYRELFAEARIDADLLRLPVERPGRHVYHQFVVRAARRDALAEHLAARRIGFGVYYPVPLHLQDCFAHLGHRRGDFPHSERVADEVLALPMYPELSDAQQRAVVSAVADFYRRRPA